MSEFCEHCWHSLGQGMTVGTGESGWDLHICCFCGDEKRRQWRLKREYVKGHGEHFTHRVRVYTDCEERMGDGDE